MCPYQRLVARGTGDIDPALIGQSDPDTIPIERRTREPLEQRNGGVTARHREARPAAGRKPALQRLCNPRRQRLRQRRGLREAMLVNIVVHL